MSKLFRTTLWILSGIGLIAFFFQTLSTFLISPLMGLLSLLIAGVGMLSVAFVFQYLAHRKPHLDSGLF